MNGLFGIAAQQLDYTLCQVYIYVKNIKIYKIHHILHIFRQSYGTFSWSQLPTSIIVLK